MRKNTKTANEEILQFSRKGELTGYKLAEYIPAMLLTNLSTLLLVSVDGIVAGNLVGPNALSSINIFYPVTVLVGAASTVSGSGIATAISTAMGKNDTAEIDRVKGASLRIMLIMAAIVSLVQIPIVWIVINSYGLSDEMFQMTMQYALGIMLCAPLGLISCVGTYQMQIAGKMKVLMVLSVIEGLANLAFDVLFTGGLNMGVAGTGFGTAAANLIRCSLTILYLARYTDMYKSSYRKLCIEDIKNILGLGVAEGAYSLVNAFQSYSMMKILLMAFGTSGGIIKGVTTFCLSLTNVLVGGITGSMRPLMGLYAGADDKPGLRILMRYGSAINIVSAGLSTVIVCMYPEWFYHLNGAHDIPEGGLLSVRLFSLYFIVKGFNSLLRLYLSNRKDSTFATALTVIGNATLPFFGLILWKILPAPFIFLAYLITEMCVFAMAGVRYCGWLQKDKKELEENGKDIILYMTVKPDQAVEASRVLRNFADENGIEKRISYRVWLCMEEMVAYVKLSEEMDPYKSFAKANNLQKIIADFISRRGGSSWVKDKIKEVFEKRRDMLSVEIMVRFKGKDAAVFVTLDGGKCIALDSNEEKQQFITDNYSVLRTMAKSVEYQYILNMNYTRFTF